ncbi:MAG TPA: tetratricopeptide repeat protein [Pirellulales bacterium]|nr:tetratricopeptide repeat protein [Pirellulales bacterium]
MDAIPTLPRPAQRLPPLLSLAAALAIVATTGCEWVSRSQNVTGVDLYEQGNYGAAIEQFQLAVQSDPGDSDSYYNLGATYQRLGNLTHNTGYSQQAEQFYRLALDMNPDHVDCNRGLAVLYVEEKRPTEAFAVLQSWTARNPASPEPRIELARLYEEFGKPDIAQVHLQEALALQPNNPRALAALGKLREDAGDRTQALAIYERSLQYNQFQPDVQSRVAALQGSGVGVPWGVPVGVPTLAPAVPQSVPQMAAVPTVPATPMR